MVTVGADSIICTVIVGLLCIAFITPTIHFIFLFRKNTKNAQFSIKLIYYYSAISQIGYFMSCILYLVSFIVLLKNAKSDPDSQTSRNIRGISTSLGTLAKSFLVFVLIKRLKAVFDGTIYAVSVCVVVLLYALSIIGIPIQIVITIFVIGTIYFDLAMYLGLLATLIDVIVFFMIVYLFCNKLSQLLLSNKKIEMQNKISSKSKQEIDQQITTTQVDLGLIKTMTRYSLLVIIVAVSNTSVIVGVSFITSIGFENEIIYYYSWIAVQHLITSFCLYLTFKFEYALILYYGICGSVDNILQKCCLCCLRKKVSGHVNISSKLKQPHSTVITSSTHTGSNPDNADKQIV